MDLFLDSACFPNINELDNTKRLIPKYKQKHLLIKILIPLNTVRDIYHF